MGPFPLTRLLDRSSAVFLILLAAFAMVIPTLNLLVPASSGLHVATYLVALFGKYLRYEKLALSIDPVLYAIRVLSIDVIWVYSGIFSLGHGAFFALGASAMGMYLMRQIGTRGVYANPVLSDFMVFLNLPELALYWYAFNHFAYAALMIFLVPGLLAFVFGWFAFTCLLNGVSLSIHTHAIAS